MVIYEIIMLTPPYHELEQFKVWDVVVQGERPSLAGLSAERAEELKLIIKLFLKCSELQPDKRPSAKQIVGKIAELV